MSRKSKYSADEKYKILMEFENGIGVINRICHKYEINKTTFHVWRYKYHRYGLEGLRDSKTNKKYSKELKEQVVKEYLSGENSLNEIARKHEISGKAVVLRWIKRYNSHRELTRTGKGMNKSITKGRTTTWKERLEIVLYCIAKDKDYQETAEIYQVSYQQVYQWVKKYETGGKDSLKDRRGQKKSKEELTPEERIKLKMEKIEAENERLKAENAFLKKLEELERRRF